MTGKVIGQFDAQAVSRRLAAGGVYTTLEGRGFRDFEVTIDPPHHGIPHTRLFATKNRQRFLLLDACIAEVGIPAAFFGARGYAIDHDLELVSLHWLREEDPTSSFTPERPPLPLQRHPGLGILRAAFRVISRMAREREKDGIACVPKFFHDAVIFFRSRLFLFLDGAQQGAFEAMLRDLRTLPLGTASLVLAADGVTDAEGHLVRWQSSPQVCPLSSPLRAYFNSTAYAEAVAAALARAHFSWNHAALARANELAQRATRLLTDL